MAAALIKKLVARSIPEPKSLKCKVDAYLKDNGDLKEILVTEFIAQLSNQEELVILLCPTAYNYSSINEQEKILHEINKQLLDIINENKSLTVLFVLGLQYLTEYTAAYDSLRGLSRLVTDLPNLYFIGLLINEKGKIVTENMVVSLFGLLNPKGLIIVDDDITMDKGCIASLYRRFKERGFTGAVGARKIEEEPVNYKQRLLRGLKRVTKMAVDFPHACCMVIDFTILRKGIPDNYGSDDLFFCFELIEPDSTDPSERLELLSAATCHYKIGGRKNIRVKKRLKTIMARHIVFFINYPRAKTVFYFRNILFKGFWPISGFNRTESFKKQLLSWFIKFFLLLWLLLVFVELLSRGLIRRPFKHL